ncbi:MAG: DUF899 domain-containing protein [Actinophytocola sp.]|uniref:DUF899 domain-containing protein n=1 Tax=Actinophytocola sp. TaxID=1872138 RepID=UPI0013247319|nr:DUF899 domain-containing protein [Actinophytocola sp.]MPZ83131.1 DUF899 domain-containing protein [Actinophytocola sp.]
MTTLPEAVSAQEWQAARDELLVKEKAATRALDALSAERRRLPMVELRPDHEFEGPSGPLSLLDLFDGRRQLIVYHFMMFAGDDHRCPGCSMMVDGLGDLGHLNARDTTLVLTSPAPQSQLRPYRERMGWTVPWFTATTEFTEECGAGRGFGISVFLRDGASVYRTYFTTGRGGDLPNTTLRWLDLTPLGRQEAWEEAGRGDSAPSSWWRLHDEY